ncbi:hypothetical protein GGR58DRAFT_509434 [Xylaria digitata]|nr:hypothetical protein GGR58DRAFT_509434 [Xylaria digitata]
MFSILSNIFAFRRGSVWWKYPMLLLVALIAWLLPISITIPPASISVVVAPVTTLGLKMVPNFDFASLRYVGDIRIIGAVSTGSQGPLYEECFYLGPNSEVQRVANAVAGSGTILIPITPPAANSSWQLDFYGPSLSCHPMDNYTRLQVESTIARWLWNEIDQFGNLNCMNPSNYLGWSGYLAYVSPSEESTDDFYFHASSVAPFSLVEVMPDLPNLFEQDCFNLHPTTLSQPLDLGDRTFLQCELRNSSYHVAFNYESGRQSINARVDHLELTSPVISFPTIANTSDPESLIFNATLLRHLSYTAIADVFYRHIKGFVQSNGLTYQEIATQIISTVLLDTPELEFLSRSSQESDASYFHTLQGELMSHASRGQLLLISPQDVKLRKSLQDALEDMPNMTSEFAPPMPIVTTTTYEPIYRYSSRQLWIAYGVAIAASAVASLLGFLAIFLNDASYGNNFSSVYRTAYGSGLNVTIQPEDMKATDPLPRYLAKATLCITSPNSSATTPMPGDEQKTTLVTTAQGSRETAEGGGNESQDSDQSSTGSHINVTRFIYVDVQRYSPV